MGSRQGEITSYNNKLYRGRSGNAKVNRHNTLFFLAGGEGGGVGRA